MSDTGLREQIRMLQRHQRLIWVFLFPTVVFFNLTLFAHLFLVYIWIERSTDGSRPIEAHSVTLVDFRGDPVGSWSEAGLTMGGLKLRPEGKIELRGESPTLRLVRGRDGSSLNLLLSEDAGTIDLSIDAVPRR
jgi:hypothetical protein